jgi:LCP family protein required for cell wall assembly
MCQDGGRRLEIDQAYELGGPTTAVQTVESDLDVRVDYWAWIGLTGLVKLVDQVGGIDISPTNAVLDDAYPNDINSQNPYGTERIAVLPGPQHMDVSQVLQYVRSRHDDIREDFGRSFRQQQVLIALRSKAKELNAADLPGIVNSFQSRLKTSMGLEQVRELLPIASTIQPGSIKQVVLVGNYTRDGNPNRARQRPPGGAGVVARRQGSPLLRSPDRAERSDGSVPDLLCPVPEQGGACAQSGHERGRLRLDRPACLVPIEDRCLLRQLDVHGRSRRFRRLVTAAPLTSRYHRLMADRLLLSQVVPRSSTGPWSGAGTTALAELPTSWSVSQMAERPPWSAWCDRRPPMRPSCRVRISRCSAPPRYVSGSTRSARDHSSGARVRCCWPVTSAGAP